MSDSAIIIFIKNPVLGNVKTRLASSIGNVAALEIYRELLFHTKEITKGLNADKYVYYSDKIDEDDLWDDEIYFKEVQDGADLGARMSNAFSTMFNKGYKRIVIIGSDCYELNEEILKEAFIHLKKQEVTIGPAKDGGYYLLGMNKFIPGLFLNKSWSTSGVFNETIKDLNFLNIDYTILTLLSDVDDLEDLQNYSIHK